MPDDLDLLGGDLPIATGFMFELDGVPIGVFRQVSGLKASLEIFEFKEGGQNGFVHTVPGRMKWDNIIFRRGLTNNNALFEWFEHSSGEGFATKSNKIIRRTGSITALSFIGGKKLRSWDLIDALPVRWSGPDFGSDKLEALEEELEIGHHGFRAK